MEVIASQAGGYGLELVVGSETTPIPGGAEGMLEATWPTFSGEAPLGTHMARYLVGGLVLILLLGFALASIGRLQGRE